MWKFSKTLLPLLATGMLLTTCNKESIQPESADMAGDEISVRSTDLSLQTTRYILKGKNLDKSLAAVRQRLSELGAEESGFLPQLNMMFVGSDNPDFESAMKGMGLTVALDFEVASPQVQGETPLASGDIPAATGGADDTFFPFLWGLDAIDAPEAWTTGNRGAGVLVAVLDEGFYLNHPDLGPNIVQSLNRNFVNLNDLGAPFCNFFDECDPKDPSFKLTGFSHGTHVAGTVAAVDNDFGVIGVAPDAQIMAVKVLSDYAGFGLTSWIVQGIVYAADNGADVINMSLGGIRVKGSGKGSNLIQEGIKAYNEAIQYATKKGALVISAAGNSAIDLDRSGSVEFFPAGSPQGLSISATAPEGWIYDPSTDLDVPSSFTNYGSSRIDFAAPGGDFDFPAPLYFYDMVLSTSGPSSYYFAAGTSMAAPHVAGVAALIIGKNGGSMDPAHVKAALRASADDLGKRGKDPFYGKGRVNAYNAVK